MNEELYYLKLALTGQYGWVIAAGVWQTLLRTGLVFVNAQFKLWMENALPQDVEWLQSMLDARWYRLAKFMVNMLLSIKLPSQARKITGSIGTEFYAKPPMDRDTKQEIKSDSDSPRTPV